LGCSLLSSVTFTSGSKLSRIEALAFSDTGLVEIIVPASVEVLGDKCFFGCSLLSSVTFASRSKLHEVGRYAFHGVPIRPTLPTTKRCICA
jgi:hypothetical protein